MREEFPASETISMAFATPIYRRLWPEAEAVNEALLRIALEREKTDPSAGRSNVNGWHSSDDVFEWPHPEITTLRGWVAEAIRDMTNFALEGETRHPLDVEMGGGAWFNLCRNGGYNKIHNHPECSWSGVYYVCLGDAHADAPPDAGRIEFLDPRMAATMLTPTGPSAPPKLRIDPTPGLMLVFPCWLYHYVNPFQGDGTRLSLAFNIRLDFENAQP